MNMYFIAIKYVIVFMVRIKDSVLDNTKLHM